MRLSLVIPGLTRFCALTALAAFCASCGSVASPETASQSPGNRAANGSSTTNLATQATPAGNDVALLAPFNKDMSFTVSGAQYGGLGGYYNNKGACKIGTAPDHCENQLFAFDLVPAEQGDTDILAPAPAAVDYLPTSAGAFGCAGLVLFDGIHLNVCHFAVGAAASSFTKKVGDRVDRGDLLGQRDANVKHIHLSLHDRRQGSPFIPIAFNGPHTFEGKAFDPDPNGDTVIFVGKTFKVKFGQFDGVRGTSSNAHNGNQPSAARSTSAATSAQPSSPGNSIRPAPVVSAQLPSSPGRLLSQAAVDRVCKGLPESVPAGYGETLDRSIAANDRALQNDAFGTVSICHLNFARSETNLDIQVVVFAAPNKANDWEAAMLQSPTAKDVVGTGSYLTQSKLSAGQGLAVAVEWVDSNVYGYVLGWGPTPPRDDVSLSPPE